MKMQVLTALAAGFLTLSVAVSANAAIVTTADGIAGYSWLEFQYTLGMSRDYVEANLLGTGQLYEGYRYASRLETELLLDSYYGGDLHGDGLDTGTYEETFDAANSFLSDFGTSYDGGFYGNLWEYVQFYYGLDGESVIDDSDFSLYGFVEVRSCTYPEDYPVEHYEGWFMHDGGADSTDADPRYREDYNGMGNPASLLVRANVPVPASLYLLVSGVTGLAVFRKKIRK